MDERDWEKTLISIGGEKGIIADLAAQSAGRPTSFNFTTNWFNEKDQTPTFRERIEKILGQELYNKLTSDQT